MKLLVAAEGNNETVFYNILLSRGLFNFSANDLIMRQIIHCRQLENNKSLVAVLKQYNGPTIDVYRFGDKLSDEFKIKDELIKEKIGEIKDYNILPEFEILFILKENLYNEFLKVKGKQKPSTFARIHISYHDKRYDGSTVWIENYLNSLTDKDIYEMFELYSIKCSHNNRCKNNILSLLNRIK